MKCKNFNKSFLLKEYVSKHEQGCQFRTFNKALKNEEKFAIIIRILELKFQSNQKRAYFTILYKKK